MHLLCDSVVFHRAYSPTLLAHSHVRQTSLPNGKTWRELPLSGPQCHCHLQLSIDNFDVNATQVFIDLVLHLLVSAVMHLAYPGIFPLSFSSLPSASWALAFVTFLSYCHVPPPPLPRPSPDILRVPLASGRTHYPLVLSLLCICSFSHAYQILLTSSKHIRAVESAMPPLLPFLRPQVQGRVALGQGQYPPA
jgi:hypothetical protein